MGLYLPALNRAKLFIHNIINLKDNLPWDEELNNDSLKEWVLIANKFNTDSDKFQITVPRFVGNYKDSYELIACVDASKAMYGCVIYLRCVESGEINFLLAKNRIISGSLMTRTIPECYQCISVLNV